MMNTILSQRHIEIDSLTSEETLINKIIESIDFSNTEDFKEKLKSDLTELRSQISESDFKVRYFKNRERALQQFIDNFPSMLGYWNKDLINIHSNNAYADYFGKSVDQIRGKTIRELLGEKIFKMNLPYIEAVLRGVPQTFERDIPTPNGTIKSTLANYLPHYIEDHVVGFFVVVTDISERKQLEEKAKSLELSLYEQSRLSALGQMASGIAHEINNPVAIIYSDTCLLLKEIHKQNFNKDYIVSRLLEIKNTALRIEKIVDGLRAVTGGNKNQTSEKINIYDIIDEVVSICRRRFVKEGLLIDWKMSLVPMLVSCDPVQISEILLNLLNNSFDAIQNTPNGWVSIKVSKENGTCKIYISNNGPIITPDVRKMLFVPFFTTKGKAGTGLGLKISRDLAHSNDADLTLSEKEETEFILSLKAL